MAGKEVFYEPKECTSNANIESKYPYTCGNYVISPDRLYVDGFMLMYYVLPLAPVFPNSKTKTDLEIQITIYSDVEPVFDLTLDDVQIKASGEEGVFFPYKVLIPFDISIPEMPWYSKTFHFLFDVDRHKINEFTLSFPHEINGCNLPPIDFFKETQKHFITPVL